MCLECVILHVSYQPGGDALRDGVESLVELLNLWPHLGLAVLPPGGHELLSQSPHLLHLPPGHVQFRAQHLHDINT